MAGFDDEAPGPLFPPLLSGEATDADPLAVAVARAEAGTDAGLIVHRIRPDHLKAALVLAPEVALADAMAMVIAAANGFGDAFGALAPSEVAAHFDWPGGFRINGARCGGLRAAASANDPDAVPDWLVIAIDVPFFRDADYEPGDAPEETTLWEEGCAEIEPRRLLESWSRHLLVAINAWEDGGLRPLHADWCGRAFHLGKEVDFTLGGVRYEGQFTGLDEKGGMVLKSADGSRILPLTLMLEEA